VPSTDHCMTRCWRRMGWKEFEIGVRQGQVGCSWKVEAWRDKGRSVSQGGVRWELVVARSGWMPFGEESRTMLRLILLERI
jgi:hypothetical protein